jgi:hypothetical protein
MFIFISIRGKVSDCGARDTCQEMRSTMIWTKLRDLTNWVIIGSSDAHFIYLIRTCVKVCAHETIIMESILFRFSQHKLNAWFLSSFNVGHVR